jgi:hypothetical protein
MMKKRYLRFGMLFSIIILILIFAGCPLTQPDYTSKIEKTGNGSIVITPYKDTYSKGEVVTLKANPDNKWMFDRWVIDGEEYTDNPVNVEMNENIEVEVIFKEIPDTPPSIILDWTEGNLMVVEAPCSEPQNGLGFQYKVGDTGDPELSNASWKIENPDGEIVKSVSIDSTEYYNSWIVKILLTDLGGNPEGGKYVLTVKAEDIYGNIASKSIDFFVHVNEVNVLDYKFTEGIKTVPEEPNTHFVYYGALEATLEATISLDSKVRVVIVAYKDHDDDGEDDFNCSDPENIVFFNDVITRNSSSTEKEVFDLDLEGLNDEYNRIRLIFYNPLCGSMPCNYCPDFEVWGKLVWEEKISLECIPFTCNPCDPCWPGYYNPGLEISGLLENNESFLKEIKLTVNGKTVLDIDVTKKTDYLEARARIKKSEFPDLEDNYNLYWSVTTLTGQTDSIICSGDFDFVKPEIELTPYGAPCGEATITVEFAFSDGMGLKDIEVWFDNATVLAFDKAYTESGGVYNFDPGGSKNYTLNATIVNEAEEGSSLIIYGWAEDTYCNSNDASDSSAIDVKPPELDFGLDCEYYEKLYGECILPCDATKAILKWVVEDETFDYAEIEVSHGQIVGSPIVYTEEGTVLWDLGEVECDYIVATMTAYDLCGNKAIEYYTERINNVDTGEFDIENCPNLIVSEETRTTTLWYILRYSDIYLGL